MYIQLVYISEMRKQKVEEGRESCRDQGHRTVVFSAPLRSPSLQRETRQMDPRKHKRANKESFLFDFKIPAKAEAAAQSRARVLLPLPARVSQVG